jgi:hypothetical protein
LPPTILPEAQFDHAVEEYVKAKIALTALELEGHQRKVEARSEVEKTGYVKSDAKDLLLLSPSYLAYKKELAAQELIVYRHECEVEVMRTRLWKSVYEQKAKREAQGEPTNPF